MSLKSVFVFLSVSVVAVYLAFLNPQKIYFQVTQSASLELPFVVFLLGSILIGAILTALLNWTVEIRRSLWQRKSDRLHKREEKGQQKLEEIYEKAKNAFSKNLFAKAESLFNKVLRQNPWHEGSLFHLGTLKRKEGKFDQAIDLHLKAAEQYPGNARVLAGLAEDYLESGQDEKAFGLFQQLRRADPDSPAPFYNIRDMLFQKEAWDYAYAIQKDILSLTKNSNQRKEERDRLSEIQYAKGIGLFKGQQWEVAVDEFKQAIRENDSSAPAYITLGDIYFQQNKEKKALKIWRTGFEKTNSLVFLQRIQQVHQQAEKPQEVVKIYREAIQLTQNSQKEALILSLGAIFLDQGKLDEAINTLSEIQYGSSLIHQILLAQSYKDKKNTEKAEKTAQGAFDMAKASIFHHACQACQASLEEWSGHCPQCNAWNRVSNRGSFDFPSAHGG